MLAHGMLDMNRRSTWARGNFRCELRIPDSSAIGELCVRDTNYLPKEFR